MDDTPSTKTILLVDDDQFITIAYKTGLEQAGYKVIVAQDGEEGVQHMVDHMPDLVLLDIIMPKMDGFEVLQSVKATPELAHIPIIVFTNLSQTSDRDAALNYGAADFLTKANVSLTDILLRLEQLLDPDFDPNLPR